MLPYYQIKCQAHFWHISEYGSASNLTLKSLIYMKKPKDEKLEYY